MQILANNRINREGRAVMLRADLTNLRASAVICCLGVAALLAGCGAPNKANIQLRKDMQSLQDEVTSLRAQHRADEATIRGLQAGATTVPVLPQGRVDELFTTHGLRFGRLTGGADLNPQQPGDDGIKVYVVPVDRAGDPLKAAGSFLVQLFDLKDAQDPLIGEWSFTTQQTRQLWYGQGLMYEYILACPWARRVPASHTLTLRVSFTDALTQRVFNVEREVTVNPPPATPPARTPEP